MRKNLCLVVMLCLFSIVAVGQQHIVLFNNGVPPGFANSVAGMGGRIVFQHPILAVVDGLTPEAAISVSGLKGVAEVQPDATFTLDDKAGQADAANTVAPAGAEDPTGAYFYARQWNMRAIGANYAWEAGRLGSSDVTVAVIDTGIDYTYPDLAGRVDLSRSYAVPSSDDPYVDYFFPGKEHFTDIYFHGTHVAATIVSNGDVVAGVTSKINLIAVKVLHLAVDGEGNTVASGSLGDVLTGVLWAADHGADVANMSLGGGFYKTAAGRYISLIARVFNYAQRKGMLIVVSAGNSAMDMDHNGNILLTYCDQQHVVCVSATGPTAQESVNGPWTDIDAPAFYTNFGRSGVDLAAPGGNNDTFVYSACSQTSLVIPICQTGTYVVGAMGTSMSAPHVSGLAALIVEDVGKSHPAQVKTRLLQGADDLGQPGTDPYYGKGRIDVPKSLGISF